MEHRINIVELLKDCPTGMELDCTMFDQPVRYMGLTKSGTYVITIRTSCDKDFYLTKEGFLYDMPDSRCIIFPKGKTTWEGFQRPFRDGDIIYNSDINAISILHSNDSEKSISHAFLNTLGNLNINHYHSSDLSDWRFATEEEKQKIFGAIKANSYHWNVETKTLEKLVIPEFKIGDKITNGKVSIVIGYIDDEYYYEIGRNIATRVFIKNQDEWNLIPNKFDINTLVPFESRVLVRDYNCDIWKVSFWGCLIDNNHGFKYDTVRGRYRQCIPYEGNEHLLGKTDSCGNFYENW